MLEVKKNKYLSWDGNKFNSLVYNLFHLFLKIIQVYILKLFAIFIQFVIFTNFLNFPQIKIFIILFSLSNQSKILL